MKHAPRRALRCLPRESTGSRSGDEDGEGDIGRSRGVGDRRPQCAPSSPDWRRWVDDEDAWSVVRAVLQRVSRAQVRVDGQVVGEVEGEGLLALVGVTSGDGPEQVDRLARKIAELRVLRGERSVLDAGAAVLVVSQFTLYGDARKGRRPSWSAAAPGPVAQPLVDAVCAALRARGVRVETGVFGADMAVELVNDGPVTLLLEV